jgi:hypothetical protein
MLRRRIAHDIDNALRARNAASLVLGPMSSCPACLHPTTHRRWTSVPDRLFRATSERFDLNACDECGTSFVHPAPTPEQIATFYPDRYWIGPSDRDAHAGTLGGLLERYRRFVLRDHVRFVRRVLDDQHATGRAVRMLDVGCGDGSFLWYGTRYCCWLCCRRYCSSARS